MTFFFCAERKTDLSSNKTPAPCDYTPKLNSQQHFGRAPFGSTMSLRRTLMVKTEEKVPNVPLSFNELYEEQIQGLPQQSSMFKSNSRRFNQFKTIQPGPAHYSLEHSNVQKRRRNLEAKKSQMQREVNPPSMPTDNLGYKQENEGLKKVEEMKRNPPHPGSYQLRTELQGKCVPKWKPQLSHYSDKEQMPGPGYYDPKSTPQSQAASTFTTAKDRFAHKHVKIPGPGAYFPMQSQQTPIKQLHFNSMSARFARTKSDLPGPGAYQQNAISHHATTMRRKVDHPIPTRQSIFQVNNKLPGPNHYNVNHNGINFELKKDLLRKHSLNVLPNGKRVLFENIEESPGPGTYEAPIAKRPVSKKKSTTNKVKEEQQTPSPADYYNFQYTINEKMRQMKSKLTLVDNRPFDSNTERFKHYAIRDEEQDEVAQNIMKEEDLEERNPKKVRKLVMTTVKIRVPFGTSANKFQDKIKEGPTFYHQQMSWIKPSFNAKGKIK